MLPCGRFKENWATFTHAVSEFLRISQVVPPRSLFYRHIPELRNGGIAHRTGSPCRFNCSEGMPVEWRHRRPCGGGRRNCDRY